MPDTLLTITIEPYQDFWHVYLQTTPMVSIRSSPCLDCAGSGKTLANNVCRYCMGAKSVSRKETAPPANEWRVRKETYDYARYDDEGLRFIREDYQCGDTELTEFLPADCFLTEGDALFEAAARNYALKNKP
jgi:hypothetical protein